MSIVNTDAIPNSLTTLYAMPSPKINVPKLSLACGVSILAAASPLIAAPLGIDPITAALGLGGLANLLNGFAGKFAGETYQVFERFSQVENEDLEKCSLDAILEALILVARELPNHPDAQHSPYIHQAYQIREFALKQLENPLQWRLQKLITTNTLPPDLPKLPEEFAASAIYQTILDQSSAPPQLSKPPQTLSGSQPTAEINIEEEQPGTTIQTVLTDFALELFPKSVRNLHYFRWFERMLYEGFDWEGTRCHWFDLYCHCLIGNLKQDEPAYCARAHKILLEKGIASLIIGQKEQSLKVDELIRWATEQQKQYAKLIQLLNEFAKPLPLQPILRVLELNNTNEHNNHYRRRWVDMVGREDAMGEMATFLNSNKSLSWWTVTGPGGMGKSRIALETCLLYGYPQHDQVPEWETGFLWEGQEKDFDWNRWEPSRPYLIVIDHVVGREESVKAMLEQLTNRDKRNAFQYPVRILVLERDAGQQWWKTLTSDADTTEKHATKEPFKLTAPNAINLWQLVQQVFHKQNKELSEEDHISVSAILNEVDKLGRPLFVILTALALARGDYERNWTRDELLNYHLEHDERLWRKGADDTLVFKHKNLLAMATMSGGLTSDELELVIDKKWSFVPDLNELTRGIDLYYRMAAVRSDGTYVSLEPDPYGEFFVLDWLAQANRLLIIKKAAKEFVNWAWANKPDKISAFALRAFTTYYGNDHLTMLCPLPPDDCSEDTARYRAELGGNLIYLLPKNDSWNRRRFDIIFSLFTDIRNTKSIIRYPSSRLALARSATNAIFSLSLDKDWRHHAHDILVWLRDELIVDSPDADLQLELVKCAYNLISNISLDRDWRQIANNEFLWLIKTFGNSNDIAIRATIADGAFNLITLLRDDEEGLEIAHDWFGWLEWFAVKQEGEFYILVQFIKAAYNLMRANIKLQEWNLSEYYYSRVKFVLGDKPFSATVLYELADCMQLTLQNPIWAVALHNTALPEDQAENFRNDFWSRFTLIRKGVEVFGNEKRWQQLWTGIFRDEEFKSLLLVYKAIYEK